MHNECIFYMGVIFKVKYIDDTEEMFEEESAYYRENEELFKIIGVNGTLVYIPKESIKRIVIEND